MVVKIKKRSDEDFDKIIGALRLGADAGKILRFFGDCAPKKWPFGQLRVEGERL
jgi:hypothetical protein